MLTIRTINSPADGTIRILLRKISNDNVKESFQNGKITSIGLIQGQLADIIIAADIAEKTSSVETAEIIGSCPQHITMIGIFGDTASVVEALKAIETWEKDRNKSTS